VNSPYQFPPKVARRHALRSDVFRALVWCVVLAFVTLSAIPALAAQPPSPPDHWTEGYVIANGIRIHYWRTGGDKPPMVMAHGSSDNGLCWTHLAKELEDRFDIILADARGHGLSDPGSESDPADAQAEDLAALIVELKLEKPVVMGHSMGSSAAAWFAAKYPDVPRAVILEDPRLVPRRPGDTGGRGSQSVEERRAGLLARNNMTFDELVGLCMTNTPQWGRSECEFWAPSKQLHHPNTAYRRIGDRPPMSELLPKITCPTLILKADAQGELRQQNEAAAGLLPNGNIVHVEGAEHNVRRDQKQRLLDALNPFLNEL
jgi:pimeloyl-ACP methyl ester carboxylesterase